MSNLICDILGIFNNGNTIDKLTILGVFISSIACILSFMAIVIALIAHYNKRGAKLKGAFECSTNDNGELFVKTLVLENLKEREIVVYGIYHKVGCNLYINLLNSSPTFPNKILSIPAYSVKSISFASPFLYEYKTEKAILSFDNWFSKKSKIILSTNIGKISITKLITYWHPQDEYWNNYGTKIINPHRVYYDGNYYDSGIAFVIKVNSGGITNKYRIYKSGVIEGFDCIKIDLNICNDIKSVKNWLESNKKLTSIESIIDIFNVKEYIDSHIGKIQTSIDVKSVGFFNMKRWKLITLLKKWIEKLYYSIQNKK